MKFTIRPSISMCSSAQMPPRGERPLPQSGPVRRHRSHGCRDERNASRGGSGGVRQRGGGGQGGPPLPPPPPSSSPGGGVGVEVWCTTPGLTIEFSHAYFI